jgi:hypothetical protein
LLDAGEAKSVAALTEISYEAVWVTRFTAPELVVGGVPLRGLAGPPHRGSGKGQRANAKYTRESLAPDNSLAADESLMATALLLPPP